MSGVEADSSSSSSSMLRQAPILKSEGDYATWKPLMEQHCIELGLFHLLDMRLTRYADMVKSRDIIEASTHHLADFGIELIRTSVASVKQEQKEEAYDPFGALSPEKKKELVSHVKNIQKLYAVLNRSIPASLRVRIGSEHSGNGCYLWQWLKETLQSTSSGVMNDLLESIFSIRQQAGERFSAYKARVDAINDRLAVNKFDLKEEQYTFILLNRLTPEYQTISYATKNDVTFMNDPNRVAKWVSLTKKMTDYESEYVKNVTDSSSGAAMSARADDQSNNWQTARGRSRGNNKYCNYCHKSGHVEDKCWSKKRSTRNEQANSAESYAEDEAVSPQLGFGLTAVLATSRPSFLEVAYAGMTKQATRTGASSSAASISTVPKAPIISPRPLGHAVLPNRTLSPNGVKKASMSSSSSTISTSAKPAAAAASSSSSSSNKITTIPSSIKAAAQQPAAASPSSLPPRAVPKVSAPPKSSPISSEARKKRLMAAKEPGPLERRADQPKPPETRLAQSSWGIDSCASVHCTGNEKVLINKRRCAPLKILCADGKAVVAEYSGTVSLRMRSATGRIIMFKITDVYYAPNLGANLLSLVRLCKEHDLTIGCNKSGAWLRENGQGGSNETFFLKAANNLIVIEGDIPAVVYATVAEREIKTVDQLMTAHCMYGHMGVDRLIQYLNSNNTRGVGKLNMSADNIKTARHRIMQCRACKLGKLTQTTYSKNAPLNIGTAPGEIIHMDTFELREPKYNYLAYGVVMSDPYSGALFCPIVRTKDKVADAVIKILKKIQTLTGNKVKGIHSDGGTEFINHTLKSYCADNGTSMTQSEARVPKHNGIAERYVRTIKDGARTLLHQCGLDGRWATQAIQHYLFIWNRMYVSQHTKVTPYQTYFKIEPSVNTVGVFGCDVYAWIHKDNRDAGTFAPRGEPAVYLGHDAEQNCPVVHLLKSGKIQRVRSVSYRNDQFNFGRALIKGADAIQRVIADTDNSDSSAWTHSIDISESHLEPMIIQSSETVNKPLSLKLEEGLLMDPINDTDLPILPTALPESSDELFEIESIIDHRPSKESSDGYEYRVKWKGYSSDENTWNTSETFDGTGDDMLNDYRMDNNLDVNNNLTEIYQTCTPDEDACKEGPSRQ